MSVGLFLISKLFVSNIDGSIFDESEKLFVFTYKTNNDFFLYNFFFFTNKCFICKKLQFIYKSRLFYKWSSLTFKIIIYSQSKSFNKKLNGINMKKYAEFY